MLNKQIANWYTVWLVQVISNSGNKATEGNMPSYISVGLWLSMQQVYLRRCVPLRDGTGEAADTRRPGLVFFTSEVLCAAVVWFAPWAL